MCLRRKLCRTLELQVSTAELEHSHSLCEHTKAHTHTHTPAIVHIFHRIEGVVGVALSLQCQCQGRMNGVVEGDYRKLQIYAYSKAGKEEEWHAFIIVTSTAKILIL